MHVQIYMYTVYVLYTCGYGFDQDDKKTPGLEKGFLVQIVRYALNRLQSLNEFCVICDEKHVLESGLIKVHAHVYGSSYHMFVVKVHHLLDYDSTSGF